MAEHASRYARFAASAVEEGYAVLAGDHRGHGATAAPGGFGFVAEKGGWERVVADMGTVLDAARRAWPDVPVFLMGHSWGSFLARDLAARRGNELAGLILLGTGSGTGALTRPAAAVCAGESRLRGPRHPGRPRTLPPRGCRSRHHQPGARHRAHREVNRLSPEHVALLITAVSPIVLALMYGIGWVVRHRIETATAPAALTTATTTPTRGVHAPTAAARDPTKPRTTTQAAAATTSRSRAGATSGRVLVGVSTAATVSGGRSPPS